MKVILIILDSFGVGALPDAHKYNDQDSNTLKHIYENTNLKLPNMASLGLYNIDGVDIKEKAVYPLGVYGRAAEQSAGKDTTCGHWEIMGKISPMPFPVYPNGFPQEIISELEAAWGRKALGNKAASGTEIIKELGSESVRTGSPIVYTSADSVLQIAAHEEVIPLEQLYEICRQARQIMTGQHGVGRIIARPFIGEEGHFTRTANRRDFSLKPDRTLLNIMTEAGLHTCGIGKINDIFSGSGILESHPTHSNKEGIEAILQLMKADFNGLLFANLVDFDMLYGHRNDIQGYADALEEFDASLKDIMATLNENDLLIIAGDHGCDPSTPSTDHSREYIPILAYNKNLSPKNIGTRTTFADIAATVAAFFKLPYDLAGVSFLTTEEIANVQKG